MKKAFAAAALLSAALTAGNAAAETVELKGCTKDGLTASVELEISGTVDGEPAKYVVASAFTEAAREITSQQIAFYNQTVADDFSNANDIIESVQTIYATIDRKVRDNLAGKKEGSLTIDRFYGMTAGAPSCKP